MSAAAGAILARLAGANGPQRAAALGRTVCAWAAAGRRAEIDRADGWPLAGWECAGDAAVRRAEPLGVAGSLGAVGKADDRGVGTRFSLGGGRHWLSQTGRGFRGCRAAVFRDVGQDGQLP